ncbi:TPA: DUF4431 domain-containing protein [Providencia stuartii]
MIRLFLFLIFVFPSITYAASFDCAKAQSNVEKLICNTPELSKADDELYVDYLQAKLVTGNSDEFKRLVKKNWELRVKNCDTKSCLLDWYHRSTIIYRNIAASQPVDEQDISEFNYYYNSPVKLRGVIRLEKPDGFLTLRTDNIISVSSKEPEDSEGEPIEWGIGALHLAPRNSDQFNQLKEIQGKKVDITCDLYHATNIHHKTPVLCSVEHYVLVK